MKLCKYLIFFSSFVFAINGEQLAKQIDAKPKPKDMKANLTMVLTKKK